MKLQNTLLLTLGLLVGGLTAAHAAITTSGNFKTGASVPTLSIDTPITFTIATTGTVKYLVFDEWVTSDGNLTTASPSPSGQTISYQINGGATQTLTINVLFDNYASSVGDFSPNDGIIAFTNGISATAGQTVTILTGSLTFGSSTNFNQPPAAFTGNAYLAAVGPTALTGLTTVNAVPEPSPYALLLGSAGLFALMQRRRTTISSPSAP